MAAMSSQNGSEIRGSLVELKRGAENAPLFLLSGGDGNPHGLAPLASRMRCPQAVIGVDFCRRDDHGELPSSVEIMADCSCAAIRTLQPRGPYYIVGYSFGGLVAIEVARLLQEQGEQVALLGMIDSLFDQRFWPTRIFLRSQARLIRRHLGILLELPLNQMIPTFFTRTRHLLARLARRRTPSSPGAPTPTVQAASARERHCKMVMGAHRPKYYAGRIRSFNAENHDDFGCDPAELWQGLATEMECRTIPGNHVEIVAVDGSVNKLAGALDSTLAACPASISAS